MTVGILEEDRRRHGQDQLLSVLCDVGCRHEWQPKQSEQLLESEQRISIHEVLILREQLRQTHDAVTTHPMDGGLMTIYS